MKTTFKKPLQRYNNFLTRAIVADILPTRLLPFALFYRLACPHTRAYSYIIKHIRAKVDQSCMDHIVKAARTSLIKGGRAFYKIGFADIMPKIKNNKRFAFCRV